MKKVYFILIALLCFSCTSNKNDRSKTVFLKGELVDRPETKELFLYKLGGDVRVSHIKIPVVNNKFSYVLDDGNIPQEYTLEFQDEVQKGVRQPLNFFSDADTVFFEIHKMNSDPLKNKIIGGSLNKKKGEYTKSLFGDFNTRFQKIQSLPDSIRKIKMDELIEDFSRFQKNTIENDATLFGYSQLLHLILDYNSSPIKDIDFISASLEKYQERYPNHPYTQQAENLVNAIKEVKIGGYFVDFKAPNKNGKVTVVSEVVSNNKITLIDLWAPWCGPCISKSKKLVPHYKPLKEKGFEVVSLLSGIDTISKYHQAIKKHSYPWQVLVEVDNEYNIYEKYNIGNSGGSQFLVNQEGKILAINPTPEEIDKLLN